MSDDAHHDDPLRSRVAGNVRFRDDDPPDVRELLLRNAMRRETESLQSSLASSRPSERR